MTELCAKDYSVAVVCRFLGLSRSTAYYQAHPRRDEEELAAAVQEIAGRYPTYGRRRVTHQLRRAPHEILVNHKRVGRLMADLGLTRPKRVRRIRTTNSEHPYPRYRNLVDNLLVTYPDQVWVSDITYVRLAHGFVYLAVIMDLYTRAIRGWNMSRSLDQQLALKALERALAQHVPVIHHSDQGINYAAEGYVTMLKRYGVWISMAAVGQPEQNGYAERLMRTIKEEEVDLADYRDFADAYEQIGQFIEDVYMTKRIHSSLDYVTPAEYESAWRNESISTSP